MQFNATVDSAVTANEVIKIDDQPEGASGLGVQILSAGGSLVPLNRERLVREKGSQTNYRLSYQARYIQTQPAVTAGEANASATFVVTYN